jgi:hypothetical protein
MSDMANLQTEIARDISGKLRLRLTSEQEQRLAQSPTQNSEACSRGWPLRRREKCGLELTLS